MNDKARLPDDFADAFESAFARLQVTIETACAAEHAWTARVAAVIRAALAFAATDPATARVLTSEAMAAGKAGFARYDRMIEHFATGLQPGRAEREEGQWLPEITEKAMVSGIAMLIAQRVDMGREDELPGLVSEAIQFVLTPYIGVEEAKRVARGGSA
jgi:hypothetical protein